MNQYRAEAEETARKHRQIQDQVEAAEKKNPSKEAEKPMQAGARKYPEPPEENNTWKNPV